MPSNLAELNVLFVCTGNICRSPLAQQLFEQQAEQSKLNTNVKSAGVFAEGGLEMHPNSQEAMRQLNLTPKPHQSQLLTSNLTKSADVIITSTADHSNSTAQLDPAAGKKTFTLKELARVSSFLQTSEEIEQGKTAQEKIAKAMQYRGYAPRTTQPEDIIDPWGRSFETYLDVTKETQELITQIVNWLASK